MSMLEEVKARIGYVDPPDDLVPKKDLYDNRDGAWDRLLDWFEDHTKDKFDALLVVLAEQHGWTIPQAYVYSDGFVKRRVIVDDDGVYINYN
jgi:hypothetical protein